MFQERIANTREKMKSLSFNSLLISSTEDLKYFTGITFHPGERFIGLVIQDSKLVLIINKLFPLDPIEGIVIKYYDDIENPLNLVSTLVEKGDKLGIDKNLRSHFLLKLMKMRNDINYEIGSVIVDRVRMVKNKYEIDQMIKASNLNDAVMHRVEKFLMTQNSLTEKAMADQILKINSELGINELSFPSIICFGENGALPHHDTDQTELQKQNAIIIDMGGIYNGYCSDMTRSFYFGEPDKTYIEVYETVKKAQQTALDIIKPGVKLSEIDRAAREIIKNAGYGEYFTHRTGHGIGSEVHEFPDVSAISDIVCEPGMVFSVEPGIYLPGQFGVRIEDLVLVTENGHQVLNDFTKELIKFSV